MAKTLAHFTISGIVGEGYLLQFEDEDGETIEFEASFDQVDLIVEEITKAVDDDADDVLVDDEDVQDEEE